jgi:hypothetical protein
METEQLTSVGGLMQESMMSPMHGFDALGSDSIEEPLPTPDPFRVPLLTFTVPASGTETVSWNRSGSGVVHWGDGTSDSNASHSYTGLTPGDQVTINLEASYSGTFKVNADLTALENLTFWWDAIKDTSGNLNLKDMGITRRMNPQMSGTYTNFNLRGCSVPGEFPSGLTTNGSLIIDGNDFRGDLPALQSGNQTIYTINGNGFRGAIHDISGDATIVRYNASQQDDGVAANSANPRIMLTGEIPDLSGCTSLVQYHVGNGGADNYNKGLFNNLTVALDFDVHENMENFFAGTCGLSEAEVDLILEKFAAKAGTFNNPNKISVGGGNAKPSAAGLANKVILENAGWTVIITPDF